jgi:RNA polymerase sigma-70 factor (ECF subfamily)
MKNLSPEEKNEMLSGIAAGNAECFGKFFSLFKDPVYSFSMHITHSAYLAEEITQDVFIRVWSNRQQLTGIADVEAWMITITRNLCFTYLRKLAREQENLRSIPGEQLGFESSVEAHVSVKEILGTISTAVNQLSPQQNLVYRLNREAGMKNEEIAQHLNLSPNTVKTHMVAALGKIRRLLKPE